MIFGVNGIFKISYDNYELSRDICSFALIYIIFFGGFGTNLSMARGIIKKSLILSSLGVIFTSFSKYLKKANTSTTVAKNTQKVVAKKDNSPKKDTSAIAQKVDTTRMAQKEVNNTPAEEVAMDVIKMYIVKKGDTLYSIARRSGVSVDDLMARNNMSNFNLNMGQILVIRE